MRILLVMLAGLFTAAASAAERVWIEVQPGKMAAVERALDRETQLRREYRFNQINAFVVTAPSAVIKRLRKRRDIVSIEPDRKRYPMVQETPYGIDMVRARDVWDVDRNGEIDPAAATGAGAMVCVIDSGIEAAHPDFAGVNLVGGFPEGWDSDTCGHGSHVAGTIAAMNNDIGVVGVSPGAVDLYIAKVFDGENCAYSYSSGIADAAFQCAAAGADVINMSLGGGGASRLESRAFDWVLREGVLSVAAAGNDGSQSYSYPASYPSVVSVAAVDSSANVANFSQKNDAVELAAPGVDVISTVPVGVDAGLNVVDTDYEANGIDGAPYGTATGLLADGGLCTSPGSWSGLVVLCERGDNSFGEKITAVQRGGGVAAVIYNNEAGNFLGTIGPRDRAFIPAISLSQVDGGSLVATSLGVGATVDVAEIVGSYEAFSGTSMATPHVAGAAAVLFSSDPSLTPDAVRMALRNTAYDRGASGFDNAYGHGLIDVYAAWQSLGAGTSPASAAAASQRVTR